jgi:hypothetical protein
VVGENIIEAADDNWFAGGPAGLLAVAETDPRGRIVNLFAGTSTASPSYYMVRARGDLSALTEVQSGDILGALRWAGQDQTGAPQISTSASIEGFAAENFTASAKGTYLVFEVTPIGSITNAEALRITEDSGLQLVASDGAAVGAADTAKLRYNDSLGTLQVSLDGAAYIDIATTDEITLDRAYDGGTTITIDAGAIVGLLTGVGETSTDAVTGLYLRNTTASTASNPQWSPIFALEGTSWDSDEGGGSENEVTRFGLQLRTLDASGGGGAVHFLFDLDAGGYVNAGGIADDGVWTSVSDVIVGGDLIPSGATNNIGNGSSNFSFITAATQLRTSQAVQDGVSMTAALSIQSAPHTDLSDGNAIYVDFDIDSFINFVDVTTDQTAVRILAPTYTSDDGGGDTIVNATTLYINSAPGGGTNVTITNPRAIWVDEGDVLFDDGLEVGGDFVHTGSGFGIFGASAAAQQVSGADLTNNVTSGGTDDQIDDITNLTNYAVASVSIRNAIYQLARKLKQVNDGLRVYGALT